MDKGNAGRTGRDRVSDHHRHEEAIKYLEERGQSLHDMYGMEAIHNIRKRIKWLEDFKDAHSYANFLVEQIKTENKELRAVAAWAKPYLSEELHLIQQADQFDGRLTKERELAELLGIFEKQP
jgi:hypothetical protein